MTPRGRRGFTLVEVSVVVTVVGFLALALHQAYVRHGRFIAWAEQVVMANDAFRVAGSLLSADLREAVPAQDDVALLDSDSISVRTTAGFGFVCDVEANPARIAIHRVMGRMPDDPADSLMVYATTGWRTTEVTATEAPGLGGLSCGGQTPEAQLRLPSGGADDVPAGAPLRVFRRHLYHVVTNGGAPWLARTSAAGTEPLVGPLVPGGLRFRLLDTDGLDAAQIDEVAGVEFLMVLPGRSSPGSPAGTVDTIVTVLQVRNR